MKSMWQSVLSLVLGFIGGIVATNSNFHIHRAQPEVRAEVVRASRFELVNASGNPLAYWGTDMGGFSTEIAFSGKDGRVRARLGVTAGELLAKKPNAYSPYFELIGSDGKVRFAERLDASEYPMLALGDSGSANRLLLGHMVAGDVAGVNAPDPWDRWALVLRDPSRGWREYLDIGVTTTLGSETRTGYVTLRNSKDRELSIIPK